VLRRKNGEGGGACKENLPYNRLVKTIRFAELLGRLEGLDAWLDKLGIRAKRYDRMPLLFEDDQITMA